MAKSSKRRPPGKVVVTRAITDAGTAFTVQEPGKGTRVLIRGQKDEHGRQLIGVTPAGVECYYQWKSWHTNERFAVVCADFDRGYVPIYVDRL